MSTIAAEHPDVLGPYLDLLRDRRSAGGLEVALQVLAAERSDLTSAALRYLERVGDAVHFEPLLTALRASIATDSELVDQFVRCALNLNCCLPLDVLEHLLLNSQSANVRQMSFLSAALCGSELSSAAHEAGARSLDEVGDSTPVVSQWRRDAVEIAILQRRGSFEWETLGELNFGDRNGRLEVAGPLELAGGRFATIWRIAGLTHAWNGTAFFEIGQTAGESRASALHEADITRAQLELDLGVRAPARIKNGARRFLPLGWRP